MSRECNIVGDLMPLYIEDLCSQDSKDWVESHLGTCENCRKKIEKLRGTELSVNAIEKKEVNALSGIKKYIANKQMLNYGLFLLAVAVVVIGLLILSDEINYEIGERVYLIFMPLVMLSTAVAFERNFLLLEQKEACKGWLFIIQGAVLILSICLMGYAVFAVEKGVLFLGLPLVKMGPVVATILQVFIAVSLVIFLSHLYQVIYREKRYSCWSNLSIFTIFLNLSYYNLLRNMVDTIEPGFLRISLTLSGIFAVASLLLLWIKKLDLPEREMT